MLPQPGRKTSHTTVTLMLNTDLLSGMVGGLARPRSPSTAALWEAGTTVQVAAPADHSNDGTHEIAYRSTDAVGNREADKTATVLIDTLPPIDARRHRRRPAVTPPTP